MSAHVSPTCAHSSTVSNLAVIVAESFAEPLFMDNMASLSDCIREYRQLAVPMKAVELNQCGVIAPNYIFHL